MFEKSIDNIELKITTLMQKTKIPGLSLAILKDNKIIYSRGFGNRDIANNLPVTPDTLFGIGSCTKVFTCIAIMQLADQGKLSIEDPVSKYLPFKLGINDKPIRIHHLMSHSSGIPNLGTATVLISRHGPVEETWIPFASKNDFYIFLNGAKNEIADEPGKRYFYFNSGFTLLGEIIEKVSGLRYEEYVKEFILNPLEMKRSTFLKEVFNKDNDKMTAYIVEKDMPVVKNHPFDQFIYAAGGLLSSVNEMTNFLKMVLNKGKFKDKQIVKTESLEKMFSIQIETPVNFLGKSGYGFGLAISEDFLGYKLISHGGSTGMSSAQFSFIPELNMGFVTEANVGNGMGILIGQTLLCILMDKNPEEEIPFYQIQSKMEQLTGEYVSYRELTKIKVFTDNGILVAESEFREIKTRYVLIPEDPKITDYKFYIYNVGNKLSVYFELKENGKIDLFLERNCFHKVK